MVSQSAHSVHARSTAATVPSRRHADEHVRVGRQRINATFVFGQLADRDPRPPRRSATAREQRTQLEQARGRLASHERLQVHAQLARARAQGARVDAERAQEQLLRAHSPTSRGRSSGEGGVGGIGVSANSPDACAYGGVPVVYHTSYTSYTGADGDSLPDHARFASPAREAVGLEGVGEVLGGVLLLAACSAVADVVLGVGLGRLSACRCRRPQRAAIQSASGSLAPRYSAVACSTALHGAEPVAVPLDRAGDDPRQDGGALGRVVREGALVRGVALTSGDDVGERQEPDAPPGGIVARGDRRPLVGSEPEGERRVELGRVAVQASRDDPLAAGQSLEPRGVEALAGTDLGRAHHPRSRQPCDAGCRPVAVAVRGEEGREV